MNIPQDTIREALKVVLGTASIQTSYTSFLVQLWGSFFLVTANVHFYFSTMQM